MWLNQTKNCSSVKEAVNKTKTSSTEWEKIFANNVSDKELIFKYMKNPYSSVQSPSRVQLFVTPWISARLASLSITNSRSSLQLSIKNTNNPNKKWVEDLNSYFSKDIQMTKCRKRCGTALIIREMHIKITMNYNLMPVRMAIIKKPTNYTSACCW